MLIGGVVHHHVQHDPDAARVRLAHQAVKVGQLAKDRVDVVIVAHVVAEIGHGRGIDRAEPDRVNPQPLQVIQLGDDAGQVAHAVAVRVGKAARIDLVDDAVAPPDRLWISRFGLQIAHS